MKQSIGVHGMSCEGCESTVKEALESVQGVTAVNVDRGNDSATVEGSADKETLIAAVEDAGYDAASSV